MGSCGNNSMEIERATSMPYTGDSHSLEYSLASRSRRLDLDRHSIGIMDPSSHMSDMSGFYKPKNSTAPYTRPEDAQAGNLLNQAAEKNASVQQKYGAGQARMLYWNVSGV